MPSKSILLGLAILVTPHAAYATAFTGNMLLRDCGTVPTQDATATYALGNCTGYIWGVADVLEASKLYCPTEDSTNGEIVDIVTKYLTDHPETRDRYALRSVMAALSTAFPCPEK